MTHATAALVPAIGRILKKAVVPDFLGEVTADTQLLGTGLNLDSVALLELIDEIEREFEVEFGDADFSAEVFAEVGCLANVVATKLQLQHA